MQTIAEAVAGYRRLNRMTQAEVGEASGTSRHFVWRIESGQRPDHDADLGRIAAVAGVPRATVERLVDGHELVLAGYDAARVAP